MVLLGRFASRFVIRGARNIQPFSPQFHPVFRPVSRYFASAPSYPKTLSVRYDGLVMQCIIAALVYFVPQDAILLLGVGWIWHAKSTTISPIRHFKDVDAAVDSWKEMKGIEHVTVSEGFVATHVELGGPVVEE